MNVRIVRVAVRPRIVPMRMDMRLTRRIFRAVGVLMVLIVGVRMLMLEQFMRVPMAVVLGEMEPEAHSQEQGSREKGKCYGLPPEEETQGGTDKGGEREIGASSRRAQLAKRPYE